MVSTPSSFRMLLPLICAVAVGITGLGTVIPVLPFFAVSLGARADVAAMIYSAFSAAALLSGPFWGRLSDRIGRKPVLLLSISLTFLSYVWMANVTQLWELYGCRILAGLSAGWMAVGYAYVADVTPPEKRASMMGMLGAAFGLGFTLGPGLGAWSVGMAQTDFRLPPMIAAICYCLAALLVLVFLKEPARMRPGAVTGAPRLALLRNRDLLPVLALYLCVFLMFTGIDGTFALWGKLRFGLGPRDIGLFLIFVGVILILVQSNVGRIIRMFGETRVIVFALFLMIAVFLTMAFMPLAAAIFLPLGLYAVSVALFGPAMQSLISRTVDADRQGSAMGLAQATMNLARILGPAWAGFLLAYGGSAAPFLTGAVVLIPISLVAIPVVLRARRFIQAREALKSAPFQVAVDGSSYP